VCVWECVCVCVCARVHVRVCVYQTRDTGTLHARAHSHKFSQIFIHTNTQQKVDKPWYKECILQFVSVSRMVLKLNKKGPWCQNSIWKLQWGTLQWGITRFECYDVHWALNSSVNTKTMGWGVLQRVFEVGVACLICFFYLGWRWR
jgi:hypothetical protein